MRLIYSCRGALPARTRDEEQKREAVNLIIAKLAVVYLPLQLQLSPFICLYSWGLTAVQVQVSSGHVAAVCGDSRGVTPPEPFHAVYNCY